MRRENKAFTEARSMWKQGKTAVFFSYNFLPIYIYIHIFVCLCLPAELALLCVLKLL